MFKRILILFISTFLISSTAMADGQKLDLSAYKGKVVMVDFWASWCTPCRKSFPWLNKMQNTLKSKGLVIIGVNVDENPQDAQNFLKRYPAYFKIIFDSAGNHAAYYNVMGMPSSLIFDRQGKRIEQHVGFKESHLKEYEDNINRALAK